MEEYLGNSRKTVIRDCNALFPGVIENSLCRKEEGPITESLSLLAQSKPSDNFFIYGPSGSGKTAIANHIVKHLHERSMNILCLYINCWNYNSSMVIYTKIAEGLGQPVSRRGRAADEIFDSVTLLMKKARKPVLLVLDEFNGLIENGDTRILHNIAAAGAQGARFGIVGVSEDLCSLAKLDSGIRDHLGFIPVGIRGHTQDELVGLLRIKAEKSLAPGSYDENTLEAIARIGLEHSGNAHIAMELLKHAAVCAETEGKERLDLSDIDLASFHVPSCLKPEESIIKDILLSGEKTSSELYGEFCKKIVLSKQHIRNHLRSMQAKGMIDMETVMIGNRPKHMLIRLKEGVG